MHVRLGERSGLRDLGHVRRFGAAARRNLRRAGTLKKRSRTSIDVPSGDAGRRATRTASAALERDLGALVLAGGARAQGEAAHRRDARAEPRRESRGSSMRCRVFDARGSCWSRGAERRRASRRRSACRRRRRSPETSADAAGLHVDLHASRAGVERVLDELLHDARRDARHLAGGNLVQRGIVRQHADGRARAFPGSRLVGAIGRGSGGDRFEERLGPPARERDRGEREEPDVHDGELDALNPPPERRVTMNACSGASFWMLLPSRTTSGNPFASHAPCETRSRYAREQRVRGEGLTRGFARRAGRSWRGRSRRGEILQGAASPR